MSPRQLFDGSWPYIDIIDSASFIPWGEIEYWVFYEAAA
jgi:hypothetical protein